MVALGNSSLHHPRCPVSNNGNQTEEEAAVSVVSLTVAEAVVVSEVDLTLAEAAGGAVASVVGLRAAGMDAVEVITLTIIMVVAAGVEEVS